MADYRAHDLGLVKSLLDSVQDQVQNADRKVQFVLALNGFLAAAFSFGGENTLRQMQLEGMTALRVLIVIIGAVLLISMILATLFGILALVPRLRVGQKRSLAFFQDVAAMPLERFTEEFAGLSELQLQTHLLSQIHANSTIARVKYAWAGRATRVLTVTLISWTLMQILLFIQ